jgi:hypothetical protein
MLIVQIALGIVLAVVLLAFLPQILSISIWIAAAAVVVAVFIGALIFGYDLIREYTPDSSVVFGIIILFVLIFIIYEYISEFIHSTSLRKSEITNDNKRFYFLFKKLKEVRLIASAFWNNKNYAGKIYLTFFFLFIVGFLVYWFVD